jgi:hypothetical protein
VSPGPAAPATAAEAVARARQAEPTKMNWQSALGTILAIAGVLGAYTLFLGRLEVIISIHWIWNRDFAHSRFLVGFVGKCPLDEPNHPGHIFRFQGVEQDASVVALNRTMMHELQEENRKLAESVAYMHG